MAVWGEIQQKGEITDIKQVMNYVYQLEEQIRYALSHLGDENITPGSIGVEQLTPGVKQNITNIEINVEAAQNRIRETGNVLNNRITNEIGDFSVLSQTATSITQAVSDKLGNYSTTRQTEELISTYVGNALGAYSNTTQTADMIANYVTNALGSYSTSLQTADMIANYVANNAYGQVSGITITSPGIEITGSQYVKIGTNGRLIVESGNFTIDYSGNVEVTGKITATSGAIGGFIVNDLGLGSGNGVSIRRDFVDEFSVRHYGAVTVSDLTPGSGGNLTFRASTSGTVEINGYNLSNGWIKDASVSGNTLTLTKHDGNTVNFNKAGSVDSVKLEAVSGNVASFTAAAYDSSDNQLGTPVGGEVYLDQSAANYSRNTWACVRPTGGNAVAHVTLAGYWDAAQAAAPSASVGSVVFSGSSSDVYAKAYDAGGTLLKTSANHLTISFSSFTFTRDTQVVIKEWDSNGAPVGTLLSAPLASYWDAARAAT